MSNQNYRGIQNAQALKALSVALRNPDARCAIGMAENLEAQAMEFVYTGQQLSYVVPTLDDLPREQVVPNTFVGPVVSESEFGKDFYLGEPVYTDVETGV